MIKYYKNFIALIKLDLQFYDGKSVLSILTHSNIIRLVIYSFIFIVLSIKYPYKALFVMIIALYIIKTKTNTLPVKLHSGDPYVIQLTPGLLGFLVFLPNTVITTYSYVKEHHLELPVISTLVATIGFSAIWYILKKPDHTKTEISLEDMKEKAKIDGGLTEENLSYLEANNLLESFLSSSPLTTPKEEHKLLSFDQETKDLIANQKESLLSSSSYLDDYIEKTNPTPVLINTPTAFSKESLEHINSLIYLSTCGLLPSLLGAGFVKHLPVVFESSYPLQPLPNMDNITENPMIKEMGYKEITIKRTIISKLFTYKEIFDKESVTNEDYTLYTDGIETANIDFEKDIYNVLIGPESLTRNKMLVNCLSQNYDSKNWVNILHFILLPLNRLADMQTTVEENTMPIEASSNLKSVETRLSKVYNALKVLVVYNPKVLSIDLSEYELLTYAKDTIHKEYTIIGTQTTSITP